MRAPMMLLGRVLLGWLFAASIADAQVYPDRPITIVHGFGAGGGTDLFLRAIDVTHVPYRGGLQAEADVASGQVKMMFNVLPSALPMTNAGKLRPLAPDFAKAMS